MGNHNQNMLYFKNLFSIKKKKMEFSNFSLDEIKYKYEICVLISKDYIIKKSK